MQCPKGLLHASCTGGDELAAKPTLEPQGSGDFALMIGSAAVSSHNGYGGALLREKSPIWKRLGRSTAERGHGCHPGHVRARRGNNASATGLQRRPWKRSPIMPRSHTMVQTSSAADQASLMARLITSKRRKNVSERPSTTSPHSLACLPSSTSPRASVCLPSPRSHHSPMSAEPYESVLSCLMMFHRYREKSLGAPVRDERAVCARVFAGEAWEGDSGRWHSLPRSTLFIHGLVFTPSTCVVAARERDRASSRGDAVGVETS